MGFLERLEAEFPALRRAGVILVALGVGFGGGLWYRADQVTTAKNEAAAASRLVDIKNAELAAIQKQLSEMVEPEQNADSSNEGGSDKAPVPPVTPGWAPKTSPDDGTPIETSKPKNGPKDGWADDTFDPSN